MCRHGLVDVVVVGDLMRLSRDMRNSLRFEYELARLGVKVIDVDTPDADEMARMFTYLQGPWQRQQIRKVTHRGVLAVAGAGCWASGTPPFGWRIVQAPDNPKRKVPALHDAEAATIRVGVEMVVDDKLTLWEAAAKLNALGHFPRNGGRWDNMNLRRTLRAGYLAGEYVLHTDAGDFTIRGPEIIDAGRMRDLWKRLAETSTGPRPGNHVYPLTRRVIGLCGQPYNGVYRSDRDLRQYECRTNNAKFDGANRRCWCPNIEAGWLEQMVWAEVVKMLSEPQRLLALAQQYLDLRGGELRAETAHIGNLDRRLAEANRKRTNLALAAAATGPEAVADALAEVNRDIEALEQMLQQTRSWAQANAERSALVRDLWRLAEVAESRLADPTPEFQREVFAALDIRVQITDKGMRHRRHARPSLRISGVLSGHLAELDRELGKPADGLSRQPDADFAERIDRGGEQLRLADRGDLGPERAVAQ